jgi:AbrB family looped-hinge helix DNA binding protein
MSIVSVKSKYQIVIPTKVRKAAGITIGDYLEAGFEKGKITLTPKVLIDRKHLAKLPKGIREGLEDIRTGRVKGPFYSVEELRKDLES